MHGTAVHLKRNVWSHQALLQYGHHLCTRTAALQQDHRQVFTVSSASKPFTQDSISLQTCACIESVHITNHSHMHKAITALCMSLGLDYHNLLAVCWVVPAVFVLASRATSNEHMFQCKQMACTAICLEGSHAVTPKAVSPQLRLSNSLTKLYMLFGHHDVI